MTLLPNLLTLLQDLPAQFAENELAFLGATSRIDLPIRDKVAFQLHKQYGNDFLVSREWRRFDFPGRCDIALLDKMGKPEALIQFKANASPTDMGVHILEMQSDLIRLREVAQPKTEMYHIVLVATPNVVTDRPQFDAANPIALMQSWGQMFQQMKSSFESMYFDAIHKWQDYAFITLGLDNSKLNTLLISGGTYYQTKFQFMVFINGPFTVEDNIFQLSGWRKKD